jgi:formylglycine-generating enzyme required for sulfatase activity
VPGIATPTFYRSFDNITATSRDFPAQVSDFRLDTYEVTVGRFRKFVAAYAQNMIAAGAGKNPHNPSDTGWDTTWNTRLPANAALLTTALTCNPNWQTWASSVASPNNESLPIDCLSWFLAEAFCIWDGGRLPTEAEWNYAAAGGSQQRVYPWNASTIDCRYANFLGAPGADYCVAPGKGGVDRVGSASPLGDSRWGQADMAGNVSEWVEDGASQLNPYLLPCSDCADLRSTTLRGYRGGSFNTNSDHLTASARQASPPDAYDTDDGSVGARCARAP